MSYQTGVCNFCGTGCGNLIKVGSDRIQGVFPSPGHPVSRGRLCVRGWHIHELLNTVDRITQPMARRNGRLEPVSWDEALGLAAASLSGRRGDELAFLASARSSNEDNYLLGKLARTVFGSNNVGLAADSGHRSSVEVLLEGAAWPAMTGTMADLQKTAFILILEADITKLNPIIGSEIHLAARRGSCLVTICSRSTQIARLSRKHIQPRPGTLKLVLAAMARILLEEGLQDKDFVQARTEGFEAFARSLNAVEPAAAAKACGLSLDEIRDVARDLAQSPTAAAFFPSGISGLDRDTIAGLFNLFLIAGKIGKEGCGFNPVTGVCNIVGAYDMGTVPDLLPGYRSVRDPGAAAQIESLWGTSLPQEPGHPPMELLAREPGRIRAMLVVDHDEEIVHFPEQDRAMDFLVYLGAYKNKFTEFAHVVLPTVTYAETDGTYTNTERRIQLMRRKVEARVEALPAWRIFAAIAERCGRFWPYKSASEVMAEIARVVPFYSGVDYDKLDRCFGLQWPCDRDHPEGTPRLEERNRQARLKFVPARGGLEIPEDSQAYPFRLIAGKANYFWHQNEIMKKTHIPRREYNALLLLYPDGFVEICAEDAARIGVRDRRPVQITSAEGSMRVSVRVSPDVKAGTAYVPYFIQDMIPRFLRAHASTIERGEDAVIPVKIEKA